MLAAYHHAGCEAGWDVAPASSLALVFELSDIELLAPPFVLALPPPSPKAESGIGADSRPASFIACDTDCVISREQQHVDLFYGTFTYRKIEND